MQSFLLFVLKTVPLLNDISFIVLLFCILFLNIPLLADNLTPSGSAFHNAGPLNARVSLSISFTGLITSIFLADHLLLLGLNKFCNLGSVFSLYTSNINDASLRLYTYLRGFQFALFSESCVFVTFGIR